LTYIHNNAFYNKKRSNLKKPLKRFKKLLHLSLRVTVQWDADYRRRPVCH